MIITSTLGHLNLKTPQHPLV